MSRHDSPRLRPSLSGRRLKRSLLAFFDQAAECPDRMGRLDEIVRHPEGLQDLGVLAALRRGEAEIWEDAAGETLEIESGRLARLAAAEIAALKAARRPRGLAARLLRPAAAAALGLLCVLGVVVGLRRGADGRIERSARAADVRILAPAGAVASNDLEFRWLPLQGATYYRLEILDQELFSVALAESLAGPAHRFPYEIARRLEPDRQYFWKVTAVLPGGETFDYGLGKFRIAKTP